MTRWTEEQYKDYLRRGTKPGAGPAGQEPDEAQRGTAALPSPPDADPTSHKGASPSGSYGIGRLRAGGRLPTGLMNKTEAAYDAHLRLLCHAGDVLWHKYEGIKLRLADNTFYTCDFAVLTKAGMLEMHEVKGFWHDDARVKIKVAASLYPFKFIAVTHKAGAWHREEF